MATALKLIWSVKTNNPSDPDSIRKFHATEANDVVSVTDDHADKIDLLEANQINSSNPYYGVFGSLTALQSSFPVGVPDAWAIIDAGAGITPQIAFWNVSIPAWEIVGYNDEIIRVANFAALPAPGNTTKLYITLDKANSYIWDGSTYYLIGAAEFATLSQVNASKSARETFTATQGQTVFSLSNSPVSVDVYVDRVYQLNTIDYNLSGSDVTLTDALDVGSIISIRKYF